MENIWKIAEYFREIETTKEYKGYFFSVEETLSIVILGLFCGLKNAKQIWQWAEDPRIQKFLYYNFGIRKTPCYYWMLCLLKIIKPESLNKCFINWVNSMLSEKVEGKTVSFDGKTIRSTNKMKNYENPLHIVSAHIAELGITFGQQAVYDKSNEISAVRELINLLNLEGCMIVADALNCQKETAKAIIEAKADYLLSVKDNHKILKQDIEDYIQDDDLRKTMDATATREMNSGRIELRKAYVTNDIGWLFDKNEWEKLACIGAVNRQFTNSEGAVSNEWHYYISSRKLTAGELLKHARLEWTVESMHWLLDVHFDEDSCRINDENVQKNLNMSRKIVLNLVKKYKKELSDNRPISNILFDCLLNPENIISFLSSD